MNRILLSIMFISTVACLGAGCDAGSPAAYAAAPTPGDKSADKARARSAADGGLPDAKPASSADAGRGAARKHHRSQGSSTVKPPIIAPKRACGAVYCDAEGNCDGPSPPNCK